MADNTHGFDDDRRSPITIDAPVSRISWGGILAGTVCGIALFALLSIIGLAVGFAAVDPAEDQNPLSGVAAGTGIWWLISSVVAFFVGGMIAARFAGIPSSTAGVLHGLTVWAIGSLTMLALAATTFGSIVSGAAGALAGLMPDNSRQIRVQVNNSGLPQQNRRLIEALRAGQNGGNVAATNQGNSAPAVAENGSAGRSMAQSGLALAAYLLSSNREGLSNYLTQAMNDIRQEARDFAVLNRSERQRAGKAVASTYRDLVQTPGDAGEDMQQLYDKLLSNNGILGQEERNEAKQILMSKLGIPDADADRVLNNWKRLFEGSVGQMNVAVSDLQAELASIANKATKPAREAVGQVVSKQQQREASRIIGDTAEAIYQQPTSAGSRLQLMLDKLFARNGVFDTEDRKELIALLEKQTGVEQEDLEQVVANWEQRYQYAVSQVADAVDYAQNTAIQAAQETTDVLATTAIWAAVSLILAGFAASLGGMLGRPEDWMQMRDRIRGLPGIAR